MLPVVDVVLPVVVVVAVVASAVVEVCSPSISLGISQGCDCSHCCRLHWTLNQRRKLFQQRQVYTVDLCWTCDVPEENMSLIDLFHVL